LLRPRRLVHVGHVEASGVLIDAGFCGEAAARQRILALWERGCEVTRIDARYLLLFPRGRLLDSHVAPGLPVVRAGGLLTTGPLSESERARLQAPEHALVLVEAGVARLLPRGEPVDPSAWIDVSGFQLVPMEPLAAPPAAVTMLAEPLAVDARKALAPGIGAPPPEAAEALRAMLQLQDGSSSRSKPSLRERLERGAYSLGGLLAPLLAAPLGLAASLVSMLGLAGGASGSGAGGGSGPSGGTGAASRGPSALGRLLGRLQGWSARMLARSRLSRIFSLRQARYLGRLLDMFEQGRLDEALRHAIPLGGDGGPGELKPALGLPEARRNLQITDGRPATSAYHWGHDIEAELRRRYRMAVEQLIQKGRIEEAAFVLVELLKSFEEAVTLLEKHGKLLLAAQIAESRNLAPDLIVRQWFLAGDVERAVAVARRTGAFAAAVLRLQRTDPSAATSLRLIWGDFLARSGAYAAAVDVLWDSPEARGLVRRFVDLSIAQGGTTGARMLARKLVVAPEEFEQVRMSALALLAGADRRLPLAFAQSLQVFLNGRNVKVPQEAVEPLRVLARPTVRTLLQESAVEQGAYDIAHGLVEVAADGALKADLPARPPFHGDVLRSRQTPLRIDLPPGDAGRTPVSDAALLPDGRVLVALGETGARLLTADGRDVVHFDRPVHRLIVSDHGDRAIGLAERGEIQLLSVFDLTRRTVRPWTETRLDHWATTYDGATWFASKGTRFQAVDALSDAMKAVWSVDLESKCLDIARDASRSGVSVAVRGEMAGYFFYEANGMTLRDRVVLLTKDMDARWQPMAVAENGLTLAYDLRELQREPLSDLPLHLFQRAAGKLLRAVPRRVAGLALSAGWLVLAFQDAAHVTVELLSIPDGVTRAVLTLPGVKRASFRLDETLTLCDDQGRVMALDLENGALMRDMRV
jgi:hypothetical protein